MQLRRGVRLTRKLRLQKDLVPVAGRASNVEAFLSKIEEGRTTTVYRKKQVVFSQGDRADSIFYIQRGRVKLAVVSNNGREAVLAILTNGDFLGEECLAGRSLRLSSATAMSDCTMMKLEKSVMMRLFREKQAFSEMFLAYLLSRTIRIEEDLVDQLFNSSERRLARILLLLANFGKEGKPEPVMAKISQETLANMIGTTRSRVSFFMNKFRKLGFIDYTSGKNSRLEVHSSLLNIVLRD
jgi:CRP/FNR family cyclic AMP-dependent transcriptional regulator